MPILVLKRGEKVNQILMYPAVRLYSTAQFDQAS